MKRSRFLCVFLVLTVLLACFTPIVFHQGFAQTENGVVNVSLDKDFYLRGEAVNVTVTSNSSTTRLLSISNPNNITVFESYVTPNASVTYVLPFNAVFGWYYVRCGGVTTWFRIYESFAWNIASQPYTKTWKNINYTFCSNGTIIVQKFGEYMNMDLSQLRLLISQFGLSVSAFYDERHFQVFFLRSDYSVNLTFTFLDEGCKFRIDGQLDQARQFTFKFAKEKLVAFYDRIKVGQLCFDFSDLRRLAHAIEYNATTGEVVVNVPQSFSLDPLISFDASSSTHGEGTSLQWSHTTDSLSNRIMLVGISLRNSGSQTVSSVTYGSQSLTLLRSDTNGANVRTEIWNLTAPNFGTNTITVTFSASVNAVCGAITLLGVNQTSPFSANNGATGTSTSPSVSLTSESDDWLFGVLAIKNASSSSTSDVFTDGFETSTNSSIPNWDGNGATSWTSDGGILSSPCNLEGWVASAHSGSKFAGTGATGDGNLTSDNIDMSDATQIGVSFWFAFDDTESGELVLLYYDGASYDTINNTLANTATEDTWYYYSAIITDSQYFKSNFRIQFIAACGSGEAVYVDDVLINKTISTSSSPTATEGSGQTNRWNLLQSDVRGCGSTKGSVASGSQTMSWTLSASSSWAESVVSVKRAFGTEIFSDGFESGNFSAWTGTSGTPTIVTDPVHHGSYAMNCNAIEFTYLTLVSGKRTVFIRAYVRLPNLIGTDTYYVMMLEFRNNAGFLCRAGAVRSGANMLWRLLYHKAGANYAVVSATALVAGQFYCLELTMTCSSADGQLDGSYQVYVNNAELADLAQLNVDTDYTTVDLVRAGGVSQDGVDVSIVDCVVVADAYIGPEEEGAVFETITLTAASSIISSASTYKLVYFSANLVTIINYELGILKRVFVSNILPTQVASEKETIKRIQTVEIQTTVVVSEAGIIRRIYTTSQEILQAALEGRTLKSILLLSNLMIIVMSESGVVKRVYTTNLATSQSTAESDATKKLLAKNTETTATAVFSSINKNIISRILATLSPASLIRMISEVELGFYEFFETLNPFSSFSASGFPIIPSGGGAGGAKGIAPTPISIVTSVIVAFAIVLLALTATRVIQYYEEEKRDKRYRKPAQKPQKHKLTKRTSPSKFSKLNAKSKKWQKP